MSTNYLIRSAALCVASLTLGACSTMPLPGELLGGVRHRFDSGRAPWADPRSDGDCETGAPGPWCGTDHRRSGDSEPIIAEVRPLAPEAPGVISRTRRPGGGVAGGSARVVPREGSPRSSGGRIVVGDRPVIVQPRADGTSVRGVPWTTLPGGAVIVR